MNQNPNLPLLSCLDTLKQTGLTEEKAFRSIQVIDAWLRERHPVLYAVYRNIQENKREEYDPVDPSESLDQS